MLATKFGTMMMTVIAVQPLHDMAQPVERGKDMHVEGGAKQVTIGVQLRKDMDGVVLNVGEIGS